jgi:tetratricopeptide (TPR) repeat protein
MNGKRIILNIFMILVFILLVGCQEEGSNQYDSLMEKGNVALNEGRYDDAIDFFNKGLVEKSNDEAALQLLMEAQKLKTQAELSESNEGIEEGNSYNQELDIVIKRDNKKFYINDLTLLMNKGEIMAAWGEPDSIEKPDPNDDYYKEDYDKWLFLIYGDMKLTVYSDLLRVVDLRTEDSLFDDEWYKQLGEPDQVEEQYATFLAEEQYLSFSENEPHMQWAETNPKPSTEVIEDTSVETMVKEEIQPHLSSMKPIEFFNRLNQNAGSAINLNDFEPLYDWEDNTKLLGYTYSLKNKIDISYNGKKFMEAVDIVQYGGTKPSSQFLNLFKNLIVSASNVEPEEITKMLDRNLSKSENGLYMSSVVYHDGLVYRYLENDMGFYFYIYVEGFEEL